MATSKIPEFETRTRIVCHFPMNRKADPLKPNQIRVMRAFIAYLQRTEISGFTVSSLMDAVFTGFWRSPRSRRFEKENVVMIIIDHPLEKDDPALAEFAAGLKREVQKLYKRYAGEKEQDVWIVVHSIDRLV